MCLGPYGAHQTCETKLGLVQAQTIGSHDHLCYDLKKPGQKGGIVRMNSYQINGAYISFFLSKLATDKTTYLLRYFILLSKLATESDFK